MTRAVAQYARQVAHCIKEERDAPAEDQILNQVWPYIYEDCVFVPHRIFYFFKREKKGNKVCYKQIMDDAKCENI